MRRPRSIMGAMVSRPAPPPAVRLRRRLVQPARPAPLAEGHGRAGRLRRLLTPLLFCSVVTVPLLLPPIGPNSVADSPTSRISRSTRSGGSW
jgi:hypothetical protein